MLTLSPHDIDLFASQAITKYLAVNNEPVRFIYGIPRGGMAVAYLIAREFERRHPEWPSPLVCPFEKSTKVESGSLIVDDIVDTGQTMRSSLSKGCSTLSLVVRDAKGGLPGFYGKDMEGANDWVRFPWDERSGSPEDAVVRILEYLGVDPTSPSLKETPRRFLSWISGFRSGQDAPEMTTFEGITYDQMVLVRDIPFTSLCEHHLLPFIGTAAVAYIPAESKVIGLSKIARIVDWRASNLQVQERLTEEIMLAVKKETVCSHVGVVLQAEHSCMSLRGPKAHGHSTVTSALLGDFRTDAKTREEFLRLAQV